MLVTLLGNVSSVKPVQPLKEEFPMLVTLFGNVSSVNPLQPTNAYSPMLVMPSPIVTVFIP